MCGEPDIPEAQQYQQSQDPTYRDSAEASSTGRKGTILTGGSGVQSSSPTMKKTALGQ